MTMVVVARFLDLPQTQIAASALRSAGLHPVLFDENQNYAHWTFMYAIGGCRLAVPSDELEDALAILDQAPEAETEPHIAPRDGPWRVLAGVLGLGLFPELGWLVLGVRAQRRNFGAVVMGAAFAAVAAGAIIGVALEAATVAAHLITPNAARCRGCA